jgi:hypothetical protein
MMLSRSRSMRVLVAAASGDVVGITLISVAPWPGMGAETAAMPGSVLSVLASLASAAASVGEPVVATSCSGPLKPGPNPSASRS